MAWSPGDARVFAGKTTAPTANEDGNDGFWVGDVWIDETNDKVYRLVDATVGAAVWQIYETSGSVTTHAGIAAAHHARYIDSEAISAMGVKGASNPLNHDRYTDAEAVTAAKTVKLDDLTTPDDTGDLDATAALHGLMSKAYAGKLDGVEAGAEVNNISDVNATDLTDGGDTTLHDHDGISENTSARHTQGTDTALGAVGTKNPPIDADLALYRDSAAANVLVTSTWTQVKAFLKTYFDTIYNLYVHPNHSGEVTGVTELTIANDAVTYAKMQNVSATDKILGRATAGAGNIEEIVCTAAGRAILDDATAVAQATTLGLGTEDSPTHVTVKCTGLTDGKIPKHTSDAVGLADSSLTVSASGAITNASQPAFLVRPTSDQSIAPNGWRTIVFNIEKFDQGHNFASNTFTPPVSGKYQLSMGIGLSGIDVDGGGLYIDVWTSNNIFTNLITPANAFPTDTYYVFPLSIPADMDADTDIAYVRIYQTGGAEVMSVLADQSWFGGVLIC